MVALVPWWGLGSLSPTRWGQLQEWGLPGWGLSLTRWGCRQEGPPGGASGHLSIPPSRCTFTPTPVTGGQLGGQTPGAAQQPEGKVCHPAGVEPCSAVRHHIQLRVSWPLSVAVDLSTPSLGDLPHYALGSCQTDGLAGGPMAQGLPGITELGTARPLHH